MFGEWARFYLSFPEVSSVLASIESESIEGSMGSGWEIQSPSSLVS